MKRNAILLQEAYRRDGHADFIKRASEVCGVPRSTLKKWRQQYLNGIYTEVTNDDIESFRATSWRAQQEIMAHQAFGAAKKILEQINGLLNAQTDALQARDIKDMSWHSTRYWDA
jgi:hypothetical protein